MEARGQGISNRTLDAAFQRVRLNERVIELNENQPEFSRAIWDYMDGAVSSERVSTRTIVDAPIPQVAGTRRRQIRGAGQHHYGDLGA